MYGDNRKNIQDEISDYSFISLMSSKVKIGIIGGGKAGEIKLKHFVKNKCNVEVLSKTFTNEILEMSKVFSENLKLINEEFNYEFLKDKHLIIIASNDENINKKIRDYCDEHFKIYIDSSDFTKGMGVIPVERSTNNINFALNTKGGNPKGAVLVSNSVKDLLQGYDEFIEITTRIRNNAKLVLDYKKEILECIYSKEFEESIKDGSYKQVLIRRFPQEVIDEILK